MEINELMDRFLGFMPKRSVLWSAIATFVLIILIQKLYQWVKKITSLPWMQEENQKKRQELVQNMRKKQQ